jgi:peptidyl-prolyl cis-trans isomerase A (cyclophilin A)
MGLADFRCLKMSRAPWILQSVATLIWLSSTCADAATKRLPVLNLPIENMATMAASPVSIDLNQRFATEPVDDQVVRFTSRFRDANGVPVVVDMALFSNRTPVTRENFLLYVTSGAYVDSIIHRSEPGFVIQGGGFRIEQDSVVGIPTFPPIVNEFGISNTLGTVSMAKQGGNPDSATSSWFISLGANSDILDPQNGGFTVFGRVTGSTFPNAQLFGNPLVFPIFNFGAPLNQFPLLDGYIPYIDDPLDYAILFRSVALVPMPPGQAGESPLLAFSVVANTQPALAGIAIDGGVLTITPAGPIGATRITVRATDSVGNIVDDTFVISVIDSYATWATRQTFPGGLAAPTDDPDKDSLNNLLEYAFLGDPGSADVGASPAPGSLPGPQVAVIPTLTFAVRKFTSDLSYTVEANHQLSGPWSTVWKFADGPGHPAVVQVAEFADRWIVTVRDDAQPGAHASRFLRLRVATE